MNFNLIQAAFSTVNGASFIGLDTETTPVLLGGAKNPMKGRVRKIMTGASVMVFQNKNSNGYENMVNRRLAKEGKPVEFTVGPRQWGTRIEGTPFVMHEKDGQVKHYLEVIFLKPGPVHYELDGQPIDADKIIGLPAKREEGEQDGLENKVIIRTFGFDTIRGLRVDGVSLIQR